MLSFLIDLLQCPACGGSLNWQITVRQGERIETAVVRCQGCATSYSVEEGIGVFLTPDLRRDDLWESLDSGLTNHLKANPEVERRLLDTSLEQLAPADRFYRALILEERGALAMARAAYEAALPGLYTPEYLICHESQVHFLLDHLDETSGPIVDLATGRGELVEEMARRVERPVVATDFSPHVLRRNQRWLESQGRYERVSLLACDARRMPFKDGAVETLTTNLGLANIRDASALLTELRRIVSGQFLAISTFYPEPGSGTLQPGEAENSAVIANLGMENLLYRSRAQRAFAVAGWNLKLLNVCGGRVQPTPKGVILEGAEIDTLPAAETILEWSTLKAT